VELKTEHSGIQARAAGNYKERVESDWRQVVQPELKRLAILYLIEKSIQQDIY
jgi:hypothetical protein